ncbi:hypothetical protein M514_14020, partial [Trichuris suis]
CRKASCNVAIRLDTLAAPFTSQPLRVVARRQERRSCRSANRSCLAERMSSFPVKRITSASDLRRKVSPTTEQRGEPLGRLSQRRSDDSLVRSLASIFEPGDLSPLSAKPSDKPTFFVSDGEISNDPVTKRSTPTCRSDELPSRHASETSMPCSIIVGIGVAYTAN